MTVDSELVSSIGKGLLVFAGIGKEDTEKDAENLVNKVLKAKFWPDENGVQVSQMDFIHGSVGPAIDIIIVEKERPGD